MRRFLLPLPLLLVLAACAEPPAPRLVAVPVYCYQTLGDVDCYDRPDPFQRD